MLNRVLDYLVKQAEKHAKKKVLKHIKTQKNGNQKEKISYTPPRRIPYVGNTKLTPEQQRELHETNKKITQFLKQDWKENNLK